MRQLTLRTGTINCEHCKAEYTEADYYALELTGHNIVWNFDYHRCAECGKEIATMELKEPAKIKVA